MSPKEKRKIQKKYQKSKRKIEKKAADAQALIFRPGTFNLQDVIDAFANAAVDGKTKEGQLARKFICDGMLRLSSHVSS